MVKISQNTPHKQKYTYFESYSYDQFTASQQVLCCSFHIVPFVRGTLHLLHLNDNNPSFDLFVSCSAADSGVLASVEAERWKAIMNLGLTFDLLFRQHHQLMGCHRGSACVVWHPHTHTHTHTHTVPQSITHYVFSIYSQTKTCCHKL